MRRNRPREEKGVNYLEKHRCYLTNSFGSILAVEAISNIGPAILLPALVAELSLALWMLIKGINIEKWRMIQRAMPGGLDEARA